MDKDSFSLAVHWHDTSEIPDERLESYLSENLNYGWKLTKLILSDTEDIRCIAIIDKANPKHIPKLQPFGNMPYRPD